MKKECTNAKVQAFCTPKGVIKRGGQKGYQTGNREELRMERGDIYLSTLLKDYERRYVQETRELKRMPEGTLTFRNVNGKTQYVHLIGTARGAGAKAAARKRVGITKNETLVARLARKKYLQMSTALLEEEIKRLRRYIDVRTEPSPENVFGRLPESWHKVPPELLLPYNKEREKWATAEYRKNGKNPEEKRHTTSRGLKVRSKSELLIAERLYYHNVPFRYEQVVSNHRHLFSPDFTIKTKKGLIYWEHCGKMGDPDYRAYNKWKLSQYEQMKIVPWENLIITYDINDGEFDMRIIEAEIVNKLVEQ